MLASTTTHAAQCAAFAPRVASSPRTPSARGAPAVVAALRDGGGGQPAGWRCENGVRIVLGGGKAAAGRTRYVAAAAAASSDGDKKKKDGGGKKSGGEKKGDKAVRRLPPRKSPPRGDADAAGAASSSADASKVPAQMPTSLPPSPAPDDTLARLSPAASSAGGYETVDETDDEDDEDDGAYSFDRVLKVRDGDASDPKASNAADAEDDAEEGDYDDDEEVNVLDLLPPIGGEMLKGDPAGHKSGYVAIVGRPNAGKSTLLNQLVGTKLSIVTHKPQTTRHRILGIVSEDDFQMVLLDTPGIMQEEFNKLDAMMLRSVRNAMANADVMLVIVDAMRDPMGNWEGLVPPGRQNPAPIGVILNKCDLLQLDEIRELKTWFEAQPGVERVFPISALAGVGHNKVQEWALERLPLGPTLYPKDAISEHPERFFIAEIIREKIFLKYAQEVPYSTQVWVQSHTERDGRKKDLILAKVYVERKSQMGIIIGKEGRALKELSTAARLDIETFLGRPVFLDLGVKVKEGWRSNDGLLEDLGLDDPNKLETPSLGPVT